MPGINMLLEPTLQPAAVSGTLNRNAIGCFISTIKNVVIFVNLHATTDTHAKKIIQELTELDSSAIRVKTLKTNRHCRPAVFPALKTSQYPRDNPLTPKKRNNAGATIIPLSPRNFPQLALLLDPAKQVSSSRPKRPLSKLSRSRKLPDPILPLIPARSRVISRARSGVIPRIAAPSSEHQFNGSLCTQQAPTEIFPRNV